MLRQRLKPAPGPPRCRSSPSSAAIEPHEAAAHADPLLEAGFDCIEVPTNSPGWADSVRAIGAVAAGRALVGAGTVLDAGDLDMLIAAGGRMAVSPHTDATLIEDAAGRGLFVCPAP